MSVTRVPGYLTGTRVTDIETGTRVPVPITDDDDDDNVDDDDDDAGGDVVVHQSGEQCAEVFPRLDGEDRVGTLRHGRRGRVQTELHPASRRPVARDRHRKVHAGTPVRSGLRVVRCRQTTSTIALRRSVVGRPTAVAVGCGVLRRGRVALVR